MTGGLRIKPTLSHSLSSGLELKSVYQGHSFNLLIFARNQGYSFVSFGCPLVPQIGPQDVIYVQKIPYEAEH